jgi:uncharacterized Tic20 family protein
MSEASGPPPPDPDDERPDDEQPDGQPHEQPGAGQPHEQPGAGQPYPYGQEPYPQQPYGGVPYAQQRGPDGLTPDERTWGGAAHWSSLIAAFVALAFLGPLLVFLVKGNDSPYVRQQSAESLNFQLSMLIYGVVGTIVGIILAVVTLGLGLILLIPLYAAFGIWWLVFTIIGSVKAANGEMYRYPLTIRMVS